MEEQEILQALRERLERLVQPPTDEQIERALTYGFNLDINPHHVQNYLLLKILDKLSKED